MRKTGEMTPFQTALKLFRERGYFVVPKARVVEEIEQWVIRKSDFEKRGKSHPMDKVAQDRFTPPKKYKSKGTPKCSKPVSTEVVSNSSDPKE